MRPSDSLLSMPNCRVPFSVACLKVVLVVSDVVLASDYFNTSVYANGVYIHAGVVLVVFWIMFATQVVFLVFRF